MTSLHPVAGHEEPRRLLARAHAAGGLPGAILLHGARGVGKQRVALWIAQLQLCDSPRPDGPCGACRPCRLVLGLEHPDLHWYFPLVRPKGVSGDRLGDALESARADALAEIRARPLRPSQADELRGLYLALVRGLRRRARQPPSEGPVQVFVIGDAEYLVPQEASPEAANAILKLLEEPPDATRIIMTSSEPGRLLPTIRSRSVPMLLSPLPTDRVAAFLAEHTDVEESAALRAAGLAQGSIGRALGFLPDGEDPGPADSLREEALTIVEAALAPGRGEAYLTALTFPPAGARALVELFGHVEEWVRDVAALSVGARDRILNTDALERLEKLVRTRPVEAARVAATLPTLEQARELARGNVNPQLVVSGLVRRLRRDLGAPG
jgi:DNA polymerase-3 subunit delta'